MPASHRRTASAWWRLNLHLAFSRPSPLPRCNAPVCAQDRNGPQQSAIPILSRCTTSLIVRSLPCKHHASPPFPASFTRLRITLTHATQPPLYKVLYLHTREGLNNVAQHTRLAQHTHLDQHTHILINTRAAQHAHAAQHYCCPHLTHREVGQRYPPGQETSNDVSRDHPGRAGIHLQGI